MRHAGKKDAMVVWSGVTEALREALRWMQARIVADVEAGYVPVEVSGLVVRMYWGEGGPAYVEGMGPGAAMATWAEGEGLAVDYDVELDVFRFERRGDGETGEDAGADRV
jgi:hypothetical protein